MSHTEWPVNICKRGPKISIAYLNIVSAVNLGFLITVMFFQSQHAGPYFCDGKEEKCQISKLSLKLDGTICTKWMVNHCPIRFDRSAHILGKNRNINQPELDDSSHKTLCIKLSMLPSPIHQIQTAIDLINWK